MSHRVLPAVLLLLLLATCARAQRLLQPAAVAAPLKPPTFTVSSVSAIHTAMAVLKPVALGASSTATTAAPPDAFSTGVGVLLTPCHPQDATTGSFVGFSHCQWGASNAAGILANDNSMSLRSILSWGLISGTDMPSNQLMEGQFNGLPSGVHQYAISLGVGFIASRLELTLSGPGLSAPQTLSSELYPYVPGAEARVSFFMNLPATAGQNFLGFRVTVKPPTPAGSEGYLGGWVHHIQLTRQD
jgi:hypothetical protein